MKDGLSRDLSLIQKSLDLENPLLRYYIKKHRLGKEDIVVLGVLLEMTGQMKSDVRTHYNIIAEQTGLSALEAYHSVNSLHRNRIIDSKPVGNFVHISFREIEEKIDELELAARNARKIKRIEAELEYMRSRNYVPGAELEDIITPVLGRIITRKIAEALSAIINYINARINNTISFQMWRCRWQSIRTGVPLGDIVFRNSLPYLIQEVLLVEKKSSMLVAHTAREAGPETDRDVAAALLSAVTDYIRTSFRKDDAVLNSISFGDSSIIVIEGRNVFAAFVVYGTPASAFYEDAEALLSAVHKQFGQKIARFRGSMKGLEGLPSLLAEFIIRANPMPDDGAEKVSYRNLKIAGALAAVLGMWLVVSAVIGAVADYRIEKSAYSALARSMPPFSYDLELEADDGTVAVTGTVSSPASAEKASKILSGVESVKDVENRAVIADYRAAEKFRTDISGFSERMAVFELQFVRKELEGIVIQFQPGNTGLGDNQLMQVRRAYEIIRHYPHIFIEVVAFNDPAGGFELNRRLAEERMKAVRNYLVNAGHPSGKIKTLPFNPDIISADPEYERFRDARGIMLFARSSD